MTPAEIEALRDWRFRLGALYHIKTKGATKVRFELNAVQERLSAKEFLRFVVLKARQMGISTYCLLRILDRTIWNENQTSCIISHEQDSIEKLFRIIRFAYDNMHPSTRPRLDRGGGSKYMMYFPEINSRIYVDLESRSDTIHNLHISEMAFIDDPDRVSATLDAVPATTGYVSVETTPNGLNHFYDFWNGEIPFKKFFFPWYIFPEYALDAPTYDELTKEEVELKAKALKLHAIELTPEQFAFRRFKIQEKGGTQSAKRLFLQEYPEDDSSCFLTSGNSAFDNILLGKLRSECPLPIADDGNLKIFKRYMKDRRYAMGVDTSEGTGTDFSCAVLFDVKSRDVVAVLHGKFKPSDLAHEVVKLGEAYCAGGRMLPMIGVERNNHGHAVLLALQEIHRYPNLYFTKNSEGHKDKPGWLTDKVTRPLMLDALIEAVENKSCHLNDREIFSECMTFVEKDKKMQAEDGKHDDRVIASAIGLQMCLEAGVSDIYDDIRSYIRI